MRPRARLTALAATAALFGVAAAPAAAAPAPVGTRISFNAGGLISSQGDVRYIFFGFVSATAPVAAEAGSEAAQAMEEACSNRRVQIWRDLPVSPDVRVGSARAIEGGFWLLRAYDPATTPGYYYAKLPHGVVHADGVTQRCAGARSHDVLVQAPHVA